MKFLNYPIVSCPNKSTKLSIYISKGDDKDKLTNDRGNSRKDQAFVKQYFAKSRKQFMERVDQRKTLENILLQLHRSSI